jgi:Tachylectin
MNVPASANYVFLPWVRQGAASGIETLDRSPNQAGVVSVSVKLGVNDSTDIERKVRLYGPGDVIGIDRQQVVRAEPRHLSTDFEPNYFPAIEFDRPDFPWLFTPARADDAGILRPWLCLVVIRRQEGVGLRTDRNSPLPILDIMAPAHPWLELPDLSESWAWAHAQIMRTQLNIGALTKSLAGDPALTVSRLLCPRRLDPETDYLACLVPAFELGRKAGLGLPIALADEKKLEPAWVLGEQSPSQVELPVYFQWEFRTGSGGDFEKLVRLLEPRKMPDEVGKQQVDISEPGFQISPALPLGTLLDLEGALRVPDAEIAEWPRQTKQPFQAHLKEILNAPWKAMKETVDEPLLAPPIYGCWQAAEHIVELTPEPGSARWLHELNLDARHRAVAALGTQVVQTQQEQLMVSAWEQLGEIERINQLRRQAQLARAVNGVYHAKHLTAFPEETLLKVIAIAQSRIVVGGAGAKSRALLSYRISQSALPDQAISAPLRRLTSPHSIISTRFRTVNPRPLAIVAKLNSPISIVSFLKKEAGLATINQVSAKAGATNQTVRFEQAVVALDSPVIMPRFKIASEGDLATLLAPLIDPTGVFGAAAIDSPDARAFRKAALAHYDYLNQKVFMTIWRDYRLVFSGGNGILYGVDHRGRLRFFRHNVQDRMADVATPSVIGLGGWLQFKFLFSGGNGIIYAVNQQGQLLRYQDKSQEGGGFVKDPLVIGLGSWLQLKFLFSGGDNIIYAVNQAGQLLRYQDQSQQGGGPVKNPVVISPSGWQNHRFVFSGGKGTIYAVDQTGKLLFYEDKTQNANGAVVGPSVLSSGGWHVHRTVFAGENGTIYAVDQQGKLLVSHHETQDGSITNPSVVGLNETVSPPPTMNLSNTKAAVLQSVNPEKTIKARVEASLILANGAGQTGDPLEPILDGPEFPQPMYEALRDLSQDFLFPGLDQVPPNTVTLLETNPKFIESFLVGLNDEMSHELLWRGYPTDQRGTYFRQFWDTSAGSEQADIGSIKEWGNRELGTNVHTGETLVLLLRGELLRRYPNSVIYAVKAVRVQGKLDLSLNPADEIHPLFRGTLNPDVTFIGFPLKSEDAVKDPGWFFVIQQQPTEPRFGMDEADFTVQPPALTSWNDLSWRHFASTAEELKALSHASATAVLPVSEIDKAKWGKNAAHQAFITLQRPVRIAIHAREMIP